MAEFVEHLSDDLKDQFSGVWIDDSHEVHVASTGKELLGIAKDQLGDINTHQVGYSYEDLESMKDELSDSIEKYMVKDAAYIGLNIEENKINVVIPEDMAHKIAQSNRVDYASNPVSDQHNDTSVFKNKIVASTGIAQEVVTLKIGETKYDPNKGSTLVGKEFTLPLQRNRPGCENPWHCYPHVRSGMAIATSSSPYCTSGFVARNAKNETYLLTAGHCVRNGDRVWTGSQNPNHSEALQIGIVTNSWNDGHEDSARIIVNSGWKRSRWQRVNSVAQAMQIKGSLGQSGSLGQYICHSGVTSGLSCGKVENESATIIYGDRGQGFYRRRNFWTSSTPCTHGDSGGGVFVPFNARKNDSRAYGLVGGALNIPDFYTQCGGPGIQNVLSHQNLSLVTGR